MNQRKSSNIFTGLAIFFKALIFHYWQVSQSFDLEWYDNCFAERLCFYLTVFYVSSTSGRVTFKLVNEYILRAKITAIFNIHLQMAQSFILDRIRFLNLAKMHNAIRYDTIHTTRPDTKPHDDTPNHTMGHHTTQHLMNRNHTIWHDTTRRDTTQYRRWN